MRHANRSFASVRVPFRVMFVISTAVGILMAVQIYAPRLQGQAIGTSLWQAHFPPGHDLVALGRTFTHHCLRISVPQLPRRCCTA
jgi:hypothetical protein